MESVKTIIKIDTILWRGGGTRFVEFQFAFCTKRIQLGNKWISVCQCVTEEQTVMLKHILYKII
jgi:hypothetical protein